VMPSKVREGLFSYWVPPAFPSWLPFRWTLAFTPKAMEQFLPLVLRDISVDVSYALKKLGVLAYSHGTTLTCNVPGFGKSFDILSSLGQAFSAPPRGQRTVKKIYR